MNTVVSSPSTTSVSNIGCPLGSGNFAIVEGGPSEIVGDTAHPSRRRCQKPPSYRAAALTRGQYMNTGLLQKMLYRFELQNKQWRWVDANHFACTLAQHSPTVITVATSTSSTRLPAIGLSLGRSLSHLKSERHSVSMVRSNREYGPLRQGCKPRNADSSSSNCPWLILPVHPHPLRLVESTR